MKYEEASGPDESRTPRESSLQNLKKSNPSMISKQKLTYSATHGISIRESHGP